GAELSVVIDRGASMSARGRVAARFVATAEAVAEELPKSGAATPVRLRPVPDPDLIHNDVGDWMAAVRGLPRTAVDTTAALNATVSRLRRGDAPVVVISDRHLAASDGVIQVAPESAVANAGLVLVAARDLPRPQVMVRLGNDTPASSARVEVTSAGRTTSAEVALPAARAEPHDAFIDLP